MVQKLTTDLNNKTNLESHTTLADSVLQLYGKVNTLDNNLRNISDSVNLDKTAIRNLELNLPKGDFFAQFLYNIYGSALVLSRVLLIETEWAQYATNPDHLLKAKLS